MSAGGRHRLMKQFGSLMEMPGLTSAYGSSGVSYVDISRVVKKWAQCFRGWIVLKLLLSGGCPASPDPSAEQTACWPPACWAACLACLHAQLLTIQLVVHCLRIISSAGSSGIEDRTTWNENGGLQQTARHSIATLCSALGTLHCSSWHSMQLRRSSRASRDGREGVVHAPQATADSWMPALHTCI